MFQLLFINRVTKRLRQIRISKTMSMKCENYMFSCRTPFNQDIFFLELLLKAIPVLSNLACYVYCLIDDNEISFTTHPSDRLVFCSIIANELATVLHLFLNRFESVFPTYLLLGFDPCTILRFRTMVFCTVSFPNAVGYNMGVNVIDIMDSNQNLVSMQIRVGFDNLLSDLSTFLRRKA